MSVIDTNSNSSTTESNSQQITFVEGQSHGVTVYVQLNDDNELYERLTDAQRRLNNERGQNADSNNPHYMGDIDASWTKGTDQIGFFSSRVEYGIQNSSGFTNFYAQYLNLYDDIEKANIANNPAKRQVRVHKRSEDLVYQDGNEYTWPSGWITGNRHEGTLIEIQASYVDSPGEAIADTFELIEATGLLKSHELQSVKRPITETIRFRGLERHHRIHNNHEHDAIETLRDSERIVSTEGDGKIHGEIEKGHHQIWAFETNSIGTLGHDTAIDWAYRGDEYDDTVDKHYLKCYRHKNAELFAQTDPRAHPKIEVKARGAYPAPAWNAVAEHLDGILNAHTADYAGIPEVGLVEDMYHDGPNQEAITTDSPSSYRVKLKDYFKSTGLKKDIISLLVNNRTDSAKDILYTVIRLGRPTPYDELTEETGLTKRTIRKWVKRLEELNIVEREQSGSMFVKMSDFVRNHLRGFLEKAKPVGDIKRAIRERKHERIKSRKQDSKATDGPTVAMTDGGEDIRPMPPVENKPDTSHSRATTETLQTNPPPD